MLTPAATLGGNVCRNENSRCRSARFVSKIQWCGLAAMVSSSGASQSSGSDAVKVSPMSFTKMIRGKPLSHGLFCRAVPVRSFQRAAAAIRPGKMLGWSNVEDQPLSGPLGGPRLGLQSGVADGALVFWTPQLTPVAPHLGIARIVGPLDLGPFSHASPRRFSSLAFRAIDTERYLTPKTDIMTADS